MTKKIIRSYSDLKRLRTFEERFDYLKLNGAVGKDTFGYDRIFNQMFYKSKEWKRLRDFIIARDNGCDLGLEGYEIHNRPIIHHMNPISLYDINNCTEILMNPEYLITTMHSTHNAIHYGNKNLLQKDPITRSANDTCPWKK